MNDSSIRLDINGSTPLELLEECLRVVLVGFLLRKTAATGPLCRPVSNGDYLGLALRIKDVPQMLGPFLQGRALLRKKVVAFIVPTLHALASAVAQQVRPHFPVNG